MPLWFRFVQIVKRVFQRHASHAGEPGFLAKLADLGFMEAERAEACAIVRERSGHAVEDTYPVKHRAEQIRVLFELVRAVDVETNVNAAWPKRGTNRL